jgi:hypothetical protein
MKKFTVFLISLLVCVLPLFAQKVSNYSYTLDNGIVVKTDNDWGNIWVQQRQDAFKPSESQESVVLSVRTMGDLTQGTTFKLLKNGKSVSVRNASPGTYDINVSSKLSGNPGTLSFDVNGIVVKSKMKTTVTITIYGYQYNIDETPGNNNGLASYESQVEKFKGSKDRSPKCGIPAFYPKGEHNSAVNPSVRTNDLSGKIKPGTYDVQLSLDVCGYKQKIWLENFTFKPNVKYSISTNLNAGEVTYAGVTRNVSKLHMYPAGTAARQQGAAKPDNSTELICYDPATSVFPCSPGVYDVLIETGNGAGYIWRNNVVVRTGSRSYIK